MTDAGFSADDAMARLERRLASITITGGMTLEELLADDFMRTFTSYSRAADLFAYAGLMDLDAGGIEELPLAPLDDATCASSSFASFRHLLLAAAAELLRKRATGLS